MSELSALIRDLVAEHPHDSHDTIAQIVAKATPPDRLDEYYTEALAPLSPTAFGGIREPRRSRNSTMCLASSSPASSCRK
jgi:hypothetical protein